MHLLDSDMLTFLQNEHPKVIECLERCEDDVIATTVISQIEILRGRFDFIMKAADGDQLMRAQQWLLASIRFLAEFQIVTIDDNSGKQFDRLREQRGLKKIRRGDLLIASIALAHQATVVSRNVRDFRLVPGLKLVNWMA